MSTRPGRFSKEWNESNSASYVLPHCANTACDIKNDTMNKLVGLPRAQKILRFAILRHQRWIPLHRQRIFFTRHSIRTSQITSLKLLCALKIMIYTKLNMLDTGVYFIFCFFMIELFKKRFSMHCGPTEKLCDLLCFCHIFQKYLLVPAILTDHHHIYILDRFVAWLALKCSE